MAQENLESKGIIVKFTSQDSVQKITNIKTLAYVSTYDPRLAIIKSKQLEEDLKDLRARPDVEWAEIDTPLDPLPSRTGPMKVHETNQFATTSLLPENQVPGPEWDRQWGFFNPGTLLDYVNNSCSEFVLFGCYDGLARPRVDAKIWELKDYIRRLRVARDEIYASSKTIIALVDTGTSLNPTTQKPNPQVINNLWIDPQTGAYGRNFVLDEPIINTTSGPNIDHGPALEGLLVAREDGVKPIGITSGSVKVMHLRVFNDEGRGNIGAIIRALDYLLETTKTTDIPVRVAHHSWSCTSCSEETSRELKTRFNELADLPPIKDFWGNIIRERGIVHVIGAGNIVDRPGETDAERALRANLDIQERVPATFDTSSKITVAALDPDGTLAWFSAVGALRVDIAAPGSSIVALARNGGLTVVDGTSFGVPFVAGTVAEMFNINPKLKASYVRRIVNLSGLPNYNLTNQVYQTRMLHAITAAENAMLSRFY